MPPNIRRLKEYGVAQLGKDVAMQRLYTKIIFSNRNTAKTRRGEDASASD